MFKCIVIAPYEGLKDMVLDLSQSYPFQIDVQVGNIVQGQKLLKYVEGHGYDVVICRGGTANFFKEHSQIPIIEIDVTSYDILRTLSMLRGYKGKIGMIGSKNVLQNVKVISELLELDVMQFSVESEADIVLSIEKASALHVEVIIGDALSVSHADAAGFQTILITSGKEAILDAFKKVLIMFDFYRQKETETERFLSLLNQFNHGILIVDPEHIHITFVNNKAEKLLGLPHKSIIEVPWPDWLKKWGIDDLPGQLSRLPLIIEWNQKFRILRKCDSSGGQVVFSLQDAKEIQDTERLLRRKIYGSIEKKEEKTPLNQLAKKLKIANEELESLELWDQTGKPVLLYGETGTNKRTLAQAIYNSSKSFGQGPLIVFDAASVQSDEADLQLFGGGDFKGLIEQSHEGILYIKETGKLPLSVQSKLSEILRGDVYISSGSRESVPCRFRLIASTTVDLFPEMKKGTFHPELYYTLQPQCITIPALRDRIEDLDDLVRWILVEASTSTSKQVVAIKPDVLRRLKTYHWPGNITELKHVVYNLIEKSDSMFITMETAKPVFDQLFATTQKSLIQPYLLENQTLDEIQTNIILMVLEQEDYNQSKAAKRLGINRATLYRKIKGYLHSNG